MTEPYPDDDWPRHLERSAYSSDDVPTRSELEDE